VDVYPDGYHPTSTGTFTLTYALDVTAALTDDTPIATGTVDEGQHAAFSFPGVVGRHLTLAVTNPGVTAGGQMDMAVYDASGAQVGPTGSFSTGPTDINFTPGFGQGGTLTLYVFPDGYHPATIGTFTLVYATDVTGTLNAGAAVTGATVYEGQYAAYTFTAKAAAHVTVAVTRPMLPSGGQLDLEVFDASGNPIGPVVGITTADTDWNATIPTDEGGTESVVIFPDGYHPATIGGFTLTYAGDVTGKLTPGKAVHVTIKYYGQEGRFTFPGVTGQSATLAVTVPKVGGGQLNLAVFDPYGAQLGGTLGIATADTAETVTPGTDQEGTETVVVFPDGYHPLTIGTFTLTYTTSG
jgi:hypothetical protein